MEDAEASFPHHHQRLERLRPRLGMLNAFGCTCQHPVAMVVTLEASGPSRSAPCSALKATPQPLTTCSPDAADSAAAEYAPKSGTPPCVAGHAALRTTTG
jgi:hypothetical protein